MRSAGSLIAFVLVLLLVRAGRVVEAHGQVDGAARDAARSASIARSPGAAQAAADQAVSADVNGWCSPPVVLDFAPGSQALTVRLTCTLDLSFITPFDREDIHTLASLLDDVLDNMEETANRFVVFRTPTRWF